jgi:hypothetical protein
LPLLVVGACRPVPDGVDQLRETVNRSGGIVLRLGSLSGSAVEELLLGIGVPAGSRLRTIASRAAGNPLYVWELADILMRQGETAGSGSEQLSLAAALTHRLGFLASATIELLRQAAPLGQDFRVDELAVVVDRPPAELAAPLGDAANAGVLVAEGDRMSFRQPLIRQALYEGTPPAVRAALHRQAAERLDRSGASIEVVARQLAAMPLTVDPWTTSWVCAQGEEVAMRAPEIGLDLLRRVRAACAPADPRVVGLTAALVRVLHRLGNATEDEARAVLAATRDAELAGEMHWILGSGLSRRGMERQAVTTLRAAVGDARISVTWRARCRALLGAREFLGLEDRSAAETTTLVAIDEAAAVGDPFATGFTLLNLWLFRTADRDHGEALRFADEALGVLETAVGGAAGPKLAKLYLRALDSRIHSLQSLDRLTEADDALRIAAATARDHRLTGLPDSAATACFWAGRWDQALAGVSTVDDAHGVDAAFGGPRDPSPMMLVLHGVAALVAVLRDDTAATTAHLAAADELPLLTATERAISDFLIVAEALAAERAGRPEIALRALKPLLDERYAPMMARHLWLPDVVRIARSADDLDLVARAVALAETEARREVTPARAAAAAIRCRGLAEADPDALLAATEHYATAGRPVELAWSAEDAAESLARAGRQDEALAMLARALAAYDDMGAAWAFRRARTRFESAGGRLPESVYREVG